MVDVSESTRVDFCPHGFGFTRKAKVLSGHEGFARFVSGGNHIFDELGFGGQRFFTDDMFACFKGCNGQWGMVVVGGANVDDVDVGVFEQVFWVGGE